MKIHEWQAKKLFVAYNVPVPRGRVIFNAEEALESAQRLKPGRYVVKAQVHAGGRGKGGGIRVVSTPEEVSQAASQLIGSHLVTPQTGAEGQLVKSVLIEEASDIDRELYVSILLDRSREMLLVMASQAGGMDIEEVAATTPEKIVKEWVNPLIGLLPFQARKIAYALDVPQDCMQQFVATLIGLFRLYWEMDCSLVEVNPLVITKDNRVVALDAKVNFDDNALYRHPNVLDARDGEDADPLEIEAEKFNLNYIKLDGNVGCMVNGAGLAMGTMDIIKLSGAEPANFLDVGGGASTETIENAFRILVSDPNVKAVLINIFGGIVRCDRLAEGVVAAAKKLDIQIPVVVRMEGTNVDEGKNILEQSGLAFTIAESMDDAAKKVAKLVKKSKA